MFCVIRNEPASLVLKCFNFVLGGGGSKSLPKLFLEARKKSGGRVVVGSDGREREVRTRRLFVSTMDGIGSNSARVTIVQCTNFYK